MRKQEKRLGSRKLSAAILAMLLLAVLMPSQVKSFTTNGTQKTFDFAVTSGKNAEISSASFRSYEITGDITGITNSPNCRTELGFMRTLHYLDGEQCETGLQCVGGFCCSNACQSSSCPTQQAAAASAAAGGGGGGSGVVEDFSIDKDLIKALIKQGGTYQTQFTITNTGTETLSFEIDYSSLSGMMILSD